MPNRAEAGGENRPPCPTCHNQFGGRMPGHYYGSNWDWVPCQTCMGKGFVAAELYDGSDGPDE